MVSSCLWLRFAQLDEGEGVARQLTLHGAGQRSAQRTPARPGAPGQPLGGDARCVCVCGGGGGGTPMNRQMQRQAKQMRGEYCVRYGG